MLRLERTANTVRTFDAMLDGIWQARITLHTNDDSIVIHRGNLSAGQVSLIRTERLHRILSNGSVITTTGVN